MKNEIDNPQFIARISALLSKGVRPIGFSYNFKRRNILIGTNRANAYNFRWGRKLNKSLIAHKGELYLVGRTMNDKGSKIKCFRVSQMYAPSEILSQA